MHELKYLKQVNGRIPYCVCGWVGDPERNYTYSSAMFGALHDQFIRHLEEVRKTFEVHRAEVREILRIRREQKGERDSEVSD